LHVERIVTVKVGGMAEARRRWNWRVRQRVTRGLLFVAAGSVPLLAAAPPAAAVTATGSLFLDGLLATVAVGTPMSFTASLTTDGPDRVDKMRLLIRISATGVEPQGVRGAHPERDGTGPAGTSNAGHNGDVNFMTTATGPADGSGRVIGRYRLTFRSARRRDSP
jgi:hypothetical protein